MVIATDHVSGGSEVGSGGRGKNEEKYVFGAHIVDMENRQMYWWITWVTESQVEKGRNWDDF